MILRVFILMLALNCSSAVTNEFLSFSVRQYNTTHAGSNYLVCVGDSIMEGWTNWYSFSDTPLTGSNTNGDATVLIYTNSGYLVKGTNFGLSGAYVYNSVQFMINNNVIQPGFELQPHAAYIHAGVNDLQAGTNFFDGGALSPSQNLDVMWTRCKASNMVMIVSDVWPSPLTTHTKITNWNANLTTWAATNPGVIVMYAHDVMASNSDNTVMNPTYTFDGTHLTLAGVQQHSLLILTQLINSVCRTALVTRASIATNITNSFPGDTVFVPAGSVAITNTLSLTNGIQLRGAGIANTTLYDDVTNGNDTAIFYVQSASNSFYRVSGFNFAAGTNRAVDPLTAIVSLHGTSAGIRVDHCSFGMVSNKGVYFRDYARGEVDHCSFYMTREGIQIDHRAWDNKSFGDGAWAKDMDYGGTNQVVVEACTAKTPDGLQHAFTDAYGGAMMTVRYCVFTNFHVDTHGTESGGRVRGIRAAEVYMNQFYDESGSPLCVYIRSGSGVIWSNQAINFLGSTFGTLVNYRNTGPYVPWGGANGTNGFDTNSATLFASGTHDGGNNVTVLGDSSKTWTTDQWYGYTVLNTTLAASMSNSFGAIVNNSATTATVIGPAFASQIVHWTNGHTYEIRKVVYPIDQPGMGKSALLSGDPPTTTWPTQAVETIWAWNNTRDGGSADLVTQYGTIVAGLHFTNAAAAKSGYTPLIFPHPLDDDSSSPRIFEGTVSKITLSGGVTISGGVTLP